MEELAIELVRLTSPRDELLANDLATDDGVPFASACVECTSTDMPESREPALPRRPTARASLVPLPPAGRNRHTYAYDQYQ